MDVEERLEEERRLMKGTERKKEGVGVRLWLKCRIFSKELVFVFSEYVSIKRYEIFKSDRINVSKVLINKASHSIWPACPFVVHHGTTQCFSTSKDVKTPSWTWTAILTQQLNLLPLDLELSSL